MIKITIFFFISFGLSIGWAHEGHHHAPHTSEQKKSEIPVDVQLIYKKIGDDYRKNVQPIFEQKCASCHSVSSQIPWYASVPVVGWIIKSDIAEAKKHLEISKGFPFSGHGTPLEDLQAIQEEVEKNEMPTSLYLFFHSDKRLTSQEGQIILEWVSGSQKALVPSK